MFITLADDIVFLMNYKMKRISENNIDIPPNKVSVGKEYFRTLTLECDFVLLTDLILFNDFILFNDLILLSDFILLTDLILLTVVECSP